MEKNKIRVRICGVEYTLVSTEAPEYVHKVAYVVDKKMSEIMTANTKLSSALAAILTAVNLADERIKSVEDTDNLRAQVAEYNKLSEEYKQKYLECERKLADAKKHIEKLEKNTKKADSYSDGLFSEEYDEPYEE